MFERSGLSDDTEKVASLLEPTLKTMCEMFHISLVGDNFRT